MLIAIGAVLLLVSLFLDWYQPGHSAWTAFDAWDLVLAVLSLAALVGVAGRLRLIRRQADRLLVVPSVAALVIVVASLLDHPPSAIGEDPMVGIWLALVAALLMLIGVGLSVARVSVAIDIHGGPADANSLTTPPAAGAGTVTGARERRGFRRPARPDVPSAHGAVAGQAPAPAGEVPTESTRGLDDDPTSPREPPGPAR